VTKTGRMNMSKYLLDRVLKAMPEPSGSESNNNNIAPELLAIDDPMTYEYQPRGDITLESIAKHCIDDNVTGPMIAYLLEARAELTRLRRDVTLVACTSCGNGVQNQFSICGLCNDCAEAELTRLRNLLREAQEDVVYQRGLIKLLNIDSDKRETARLWGIEAMLVEAYEMLEAYAPNHPLVDRVADALEARPKY